MDLPNLLNKLGASQEDERYFLGVEISHAVVKSVVWKVSQGKTEIVSHGSSQTWQTDDNNASLLQAVDVSLSDALSELDFDPDEIIFGLPELWVNEDSITDKHKQILKFLCQKLQLKPIGFVSTTEAIVNYLKEKEGGPVSCVLVHINEQEIMVHLVRVGVVEEAQVVGRSSQITSDVGEALARFSQAENLPSRMILYDGNSDLEPLKQELIAHDWTSKLPFLHIPKVESLDDTTTITAIAEAGGAEAAKTMGLVANAKATANNPAPKTEAATNADQPVAASFGFVPIDTDSSVKPASPDGKPATLKPSPLSQDDTASPVTTPVPKTSSKPKMKLSLPKIALPSFSKKVGTSPKNLSKRLPILGLILVLILIVLTGAALAAYWNLPKAQLDIFLSLKPLEKHITFSLEPEAAELDMTRAVVPAQLETIEVTDSSQRATTGSKIIGDRAQGTVTLFNRTIAAKSFPQGTTLHANNLQFTLNDDVQVASASSKENSDLSVTIKPSSVEVEVTASAIGAEHNLGADTQFRVANFSEDDFVARAKAALSGGSSREIQAVSAEDRQALRTQLLQSITEQVEQKATEQGEGQGVIVTDEVDVLSEEFSAEEGAEADQLSLTMSVAKTVYLYRLVDLTLLAQEQVQQDIPQDFMLKPNATQVDVLDQSIGNQDTASVSAQVKLQLFPKLDTDQISTNVAGKRFDVAEAYIQSLPQFVKYEVVLQPKLPAPLDTFPRRAENIMVKLKPVSL